MPVIDALVQEKAAMVCHYSCEAIPRLQNSLKDWQSFKECIAIQVIPKNANGSPSFRLRVPYQSYSIK